MRTYDESGPPSLNGRGNLGILITDRDGVVQSWNDVAGQLVTMRLGATCANTLGPLFQQSPNCAEACPRLMTRSALSPPLAALGRGGSRITCVSLEPAGAAVLIDTPTPTRDAPHLSGREREVLELLADGLSGVKVATALSIEVATVRTHTMNLKRKLSADTLPGAVARAQQLGLLVRRPAGRGRGRPHRDNPS